MGISTHSLQTVEAQRYGSLGARVVRTDLAWSHVVHHDGEHWEAFNAFVGALIDQRITPLLILQWDGPGHVSEPAPRAEFARFAAAAAARYPAAIFEVLNEPNVHGEPWAYVEPEAYVQVLAEISAAIRVAAPRAQVIGPALGGAAFDAAWLRRAFQAGLLAQVDAVSLHPYAAGSPEGAPALYDAVRGLMRGAGDERPIVVSEWGYLAAEREQADLIRRALEQDEAYGIGLTVIYRWRDLPGHEFGLTREDGTEKPSAAAVREATGAGPAWAGPSPISVSVTIGGGPSISH